MTDWEARFNEYHAKHPELYEGFKFYVYQLLEAGRRRISHGTVVERLRWESLVSMKPGSEFKINQNFGRAMALRFVREYPTCYDLFAFRDHHGRARREEEGGEL